MNYNVDVSCITDMNMPAQSNICGRKEKRKHVTNGHNIYFLVNLLLNSLILLDNSGVFCDFIF